MTGVLSSTESRRFAVLDLGSNSFHLLLARVREGRWQPIRRLSEKVQLAADMDDGCLQPDAVARGLACLQRFRPYLDGVDSGDVRVVGTQALRVASNRSAFLGPAREVLGYPVDVISGEEEARLIYHAVNLERLPRRRLVVDVGGGSTELVLGTGPVVEFLRSVPIGCVSCVRQFPEGVLTASNLQRARENARQAFAAVLPESPGDMEIVGCSGTLLAIAEVLRRRGGRAGEIDRSGLAALESAVLRFESIEAVHFDGLCESRRSIFASGLAIVSGLFDALRLERLQLSAVALREGVMAELVEAGELAAVRS